MPVECGIHPGTQCLGAACAELKLPTPARNLWGEPIGSALSKTCVHIGPYVQELTKPEAVEVVVAQNL